MLPGRAVDGGVVLVIESKVVSPAVDGVVVRECRTEGTAAHNHSPTSAARPRNGCCGFRTSDTCRSVSRSCIPLPVMSGVPDVCRCRRA